MSNTVCRRRATFRRVAVLCGALALAECSQGGRPIRETPISCDPPTLADYAGPWRLTLPSTLTGSTFIHCADPASEGTAVTVPTETPCPEDPTSPCPVVLTFKITLYLKEYHPGGVPRYGIVGATDAGQVLFGEIEDATCTASFSFGGGGGASFGCTGTVAETHREIFGSCSKGTPPIEGQNQGWLCDVSPPIEPLVEFLHAES